MDLDKLISADFEALRERLETDDFSERTLGKIRGAERFRLVLVGGAGAGGAALASSQFEALAAAIGKAAPMLASMSVNGESISTGISPTLLAALCFAVVGGATALIVPGSR